MKNNFFLKTSICISLFLNLSAENVTIYSHGYGERGPRDTHYATEGFDNPNALGPVYTQSDSFYTRPAVINLLNYMHNEVIIKENSAINLVGRSCGAGIIINALAKLIEYDKNIAYFKHSSIQSREHAAAIVQAINNGRLELVCPLLSLEKTAIVQNVSRGIAYCSLSWIFGQHAFNKVNNGCAYTINRTIVTRVFKDYDAHHAKPIDVVSLLAGKITCPILIQVCKNDGVVANTPHDIVNLYHALRTGNENQTHIFVSTDAWHNSLSPSYLNFKKVIDTKKPLSEAELLQQLV